MPPLSGGKSYSALPLLSRKMRPSGVFAIVTIAPPTFVVPARASAAAIAATVADAAECAGQFDAVSHRYLVSGGREPSALVVLSSGDVIASSCAEPGVSGPNLPLCLCR
jgi:hypothetical protein